MVDLNSKGRVIHTGPRGGRYVIVNGKKVYKFTPAPAGRAAPPPPRPAPPPMQNYNAILKANRSALTMAKIRRYARNWLGKNLPVDASYKRAAMVVHPNKGNRTNAINQAKRDALFKLLGGLRGR